MQRPTSVTVFAILNLVFAALVAFGLVTTLALFMVNHSDNLVIKIMEHEPFFKAWTMASIPLAVAAALALLASGIGMLSLKPWARWVAIGYAIYSILRCIVGALISYLFVAVPLLEEVQRAQRPNAKSAAMLAAAGVIFGIVATILGMIYPILLLIFMRRPNVVEAFRSHGVAEYDWPTNG